jgi:hypothetical protein
MRQGEQRSSVESSVSNNNLQNSYVPAIKIKSGSNFSPAINSK